MTWGGTYGGGVIVDAGGLYYGDFGDDALRDPTIKEFYTGGGPGMYPRLVGAGLIALVGLIVWKIK